MKKNQNFWGKMVIALVAIVILAVAAVLIVRFSLRVLRGANEAANATEAAEQPADESFWTPAPLILDDSAYDRATAELEYDPSIDKVPSDDFPVEEGAEEAVDYTIEELQSHQGEDLFASQPPD